MNWKDLLKVFLGALLPMLYTMLSSHYPDFPMFSEDFVSLIMWIVGLAVGGWGLASMRIKSQLKKNGYEYKDLVK
jgi:hypothetical protein